MLDLKFIRDHLDDIRENAVRRGVRNADPDLVVALYEKRLELTKSGDMLRAERNKNAQAMKAKLEQEERTQLITRGRELKDEIASVEAEAQDLAGRLMEAAKLIPNMSHPDSPVGKEGEGRVLKTVGTPPAFDFEPRDHLTLGAELDILDLENAAKVSGQKFYYLKNETAFLELALIQFAMGKLIAKGYTPYMTPDLARSQILEAIGFNPRGEETQVYSVADSDLCLIGTAEITLGGMLTDRILRQEDLPMRLAGFSHCFRTEAGAHGAESRGLYRVHQFSKVEMFAFTTPEQSEALHEEMLANEIEIFTALGLCFQVVDIPTGDLGGPAYRKYDLEAWMPSRGGYGEITSTSNCTDYQSRRLGIRYRDQDNNIRFVHTLNGTAVAVTRAILAILENYQQGDGSVVIPEVLRPYTFGVEVIRPDKPWLG